ncbi:hypothetical protein [Lysinibacillus sp. BPa_S21]|uniref:hypothetical protein n=1 Tax=Lysinibacillus sp. BPa_S21 TaxID=2932478 RepID=UPI0020114A15|nr:hypothetical protein [Lysinibacillus sp. BPa_S21]MCL1696188.1 hypothetical protein [Lysinibacillus sp. BPa_S21]
MNKRGAGISLIIISAALFIFRNVTHFIVAAIMGQNKEALGEGRFDFALEVTHSYSIIPEVIALILGLIYLIFAEIKKG